MPQLSEYIPGLKGGFLTIDVPVDLGDFTDSNGNEWLEVDAVASAVNHVQVRNSATGSPSAITATGSDTNVGIGLSSKGTGSVTLWTGDSAREALICVNTASAVNEITITPSATGNAVGIAATGSDTNAGLDLDGKGSGAIRLNTTGTGNVTTSRAVLSSGATAGIGYSTGAGGTVVQATNKSTGVTLSTVTGIITMNNASLAADTTVSFTLTNTAIAATDAVIVLHESAGTLGAYSFASTAAAGSATIAVHNNTPGALGEAIVLRVVVIKSVNA